VTTPVAEGLQQTEDYKIIIHERLENPSVIKVEHVNIQRLDSKNIVIVSTVMAQTVALDYYAVACERMLESFMHMNMKIEDSGSFSSFADKGLYKLIASNNSVISNVLSKVSTTPSTRFEYELVFEDSRLCTVISTCML
jgi:5-carboxymethyl-2-hydroxymuconate isomerase